MKNKLNLTLNFGYDSKTNDFRINGSVTWDGDFEQEEQDKIICNDDSRALEYDDSDE